MLYRPVDYYDILRSSGYRITTQRMNILDALIELGEHCTLGKIYAVAKAKDPSVDRSTIYRNLELFNRLGIVISSDIGIGENVYEIAIPESHHHLICIKCNKRIELPHYEIQPLFADIGKQYGFSITLNHIVIFGICKECSKKK